MPEEILEKKALINGEWVESESGERFEVCYPDSPNPSCRCLIHQ